MQQSELSLKIGRLVRAQCEQGATIQERFEAFHRANPWVYDALVKLAADMFSRGRSRIGIGMLMEIVRWNYYRTTTEAADTFKINNNYRSRYVRLMLEKHPDWAGKFEMRVLRS